MILNLKSGPLGSICLIRIVYYSILNGTALRSIPRNALSMPITVLTAAFVFSYRWAFTCAFCKFHTFEDKDIEKHFGSTYHKEILDYIRRQATFDDNVISFLHVRTFEKCVFYYKSVLYWLIYIYPHSNAVQDCMVHKFRKTVSTLHNLKSTCGHSKDEWAKIMEGMIQIHHEKKLLQL